MQIKIAWVLTDDSSAQPIVAVVVVGVVLNKVFFKL